MSAGSRRGAMMATLRCDHPDIESVHRRQTGTRPAAHVQSVGPGHRPVYGGGQDERLGTSFSTARSFVRIKARDLWNGSCDATYRVCRAGRDLHRPHQPAQQPAYCETIHATNPCGEQPLPPYGACLLGSINLARLVQNPFDANAHARYGRAGRVDPDRGSDDGQCRRCLWLPAGAQAHEAKANARIGLGITGLADALIMCGARYGSSRCRGADQTWLRAMQRSAYLRVDRSCRVKRARSRCSIKSNIWPAKPSAADGYGRRCDRRTRYP